MHTPMEVGLSSEWVGAVSLPLPKAADTRTQQSVLSWLRHCGHFLRGVERGFLSAERTGDDDIARESIDHFDLEFLVLVNFAYVGAQAKIFIFEGGYRGGYFNYGGTQFSCTLSTRAST